MLNVVAFSCHVAAIMFAKKYLFSPNIWIFLLKFIKKGGLVLTTTIYRTGISNNVIANDFYKQKLNQKINEKFYSANQVKFPLQFLFVEFRSCWYKSTDFPKNPVSCSL